MAVLRRPQPVLDSLPQHPLALLKPQLRRAALGGLLPLAGLLWLCWPLLRPRLAPARGTTLVVAFDGYHRLDAALARTPAHQPLLLITCPRFPQPTPEQRQLARGRSFWVLSQGFDSASQLTVLARWLQRPPSALPPLGQVLLVSDAHHLPRLLPAARIALGGQGLAVGGLVGNAHQAPSRRPPPPGPWLITRNWLRLQLWRATGSTGAFLVPHTLHRKQLACG